MVRETVIASFILRFVRPGREVQPSPPAAGSPTQTPARRIVVRHVQSGYERRFPRSRGDVLHQSELELLQRE